VRVGAAALVDLVDLAESKGDAIGVVCTVTSWTMEPTPLRSLYWFRQSGFLSSR
jgi:hypothetical protein